MSTDDTSDGDGEKSIESEDAGVDRSEGGDVEDSDGATSTDVRERLEQEADRALDQFDQGLIDLLSWLLETETRARIYVHLRQHPDSTSDEIAEGTGLYPSTVREALASLHEEGTVTRQKRQNAGAGNNPYEYSAMPPSELVSEIADDVQHQLNTVFNLDRYIDRSESDDTDSEPVTITVTEQTSSDGENSAEDDSEPGLDAESDRNEDEE